MKNLSFPSEITKKGGVENFLRYFAAYERKMSYFYNFDQVNMTVLYLQIVDNECKRTKVSCAGAVRGKP